MFRKFIIPALLFSFFSALEFCCSITPAAASNTAVHQSYQKTDHLFLKNPFLAPGKSPVFTKTNQQYNSRPVLKGIVQTEKEAAVIIEFSGSSKFCKLHEFIGQYQIIKITNNTTHLLQDNKVLVLTLKDKK